jgi:hypothetical protein
VRRDFQREGQPGDAASENQKVELFHGKELTQRRNGAKRQSARDWTNGRNCLPLFRAKPEERAGRGDFHFEKKSERPSLRLSPRSFYGERETFTCSFSRTQRSGGNSLKNSPDFHRAFRHGNLLALRGSRFLHE